MMLGFVRNGKLMEWNLSHQKQDGSHHSSKFPYCLVNSPVSSFTSFYLLSFNTENGKKYFDQRSSSSSFISIANLIICKTVCLEHFTYNKYFLFAFHIKYFCCIDEKIFFLECILHIACSESFPIERTNLN